MTEPHNGLSAATEDDRKYMGSASDAKAALIEKAIAWRKARQPSMATAEEHRRADKQEHQIRFELANAAILWLWHEENPIAKSVLTFPDAQPIAWRSRSFIEPNWDYDAAPLAADDLARQDEGFEEHPLYASQPSPAATVETDDITDALNARQATINESMACPSSSAATGEPIAWMNREHVEAYAAGRKDGIAWASHQQSEFYSVPLYLNEPQGAGMSPATLALAFASQRDLRVEKLDLTGEAWPSYLAGFDDATELALALSRPVSGGDK